MCILTLGADYCGRLEGGSVLWKGDGPCRTRNAHVLDRSRARVQTFN